MRKNLYITLAVLTGMVISMTACLLGDVEALQHKASETNLGISTQEPSLGHLRLIAQVLHTRPNTPRQ